VQPCLLDEAVLVFLLLTKEPRLSPATSDKGLKGDNGQNTKNIQRKKKRREAGSSKYSVERNDNIAQGTSGVIQGLKHGRDPHIEALPLHALCGIVESEEHQHLILRTCPPK